MIAELTAKLKEKRDLSSEEMSSAMREIMSGSSSTDLIAPFIGALADKGETIEEIVASVSVMRSFAVKVKAKSEIVLDTCGTGGDRKGTFNISTIAAFIVAACGVTVAKHGNRSVSSSCGSADVLEAAGIAIELPADRIEECLNATGIAFLYAPNFHPAMKYAGPARKQLGRKTIFNIMGPMCNPAGATHQLVGVFSPELIPVVSNVLSALGTKRSLVIHSKDGLDEISTTGTTIMCEFQDGKASTCEVTPEMFGLKRVSADELKGGSVADNARIMMDIFKGEEGLRRDIVLLNAAGALFAAQKTKSIKEGMALAAEALDSGNALKKFEMLKEFTSNGKN
ncbi:MAG: anthranilate phosphoribosyltransferase [Candidatus Omnitrophica bacterium]|nr:anthranilate phosphoribosyltransferase [Candidatus Omnitrophota bacterium]